ncbi:MAG TPA: hypothetical protein VGI82_00880 [Chitinophagaceae bacterium]|jgi:hypothetical protein
MLLKIFDAKIILTGFNNLTIIPEFKVDAAKDPLFFKNSDTFAPTAKASGTFILAVTYHF